MAVNAVMMMSGCKELNLPGMCWLLVNNCQAVVLVGKAGPDL